MTGAPLRSSMASPYLYSTPIAGQTGGVGRAQHR